MFTFTLLANVPEWTVLAAVLFITHIGPWIGINMYEGSAQTLNVSWSGYVGDYGLAIIITIGAMVMHRPDVSLPAWLVNPYYHLAVIGVALAAGWHLSSSSSPLPRGRWSDRYHSLVMVPILIYLVAIMLSVIYCAGTSTQWLISYILLILWIVLVFADIGSKRLDQPKWRRDNGVVLPGKNPR